MTSITYRLGQSPQTLKHLMQLLTSKLYANPSNACFREILANALDANRASDRPVQVTFGQKEVHIRDFGPGMSPEFIAQIFTVLGESCKNSEDIGGFGLGAKSIFVHQRVELTTWWQGQQYDYVASRIEDLPTLTLVHSQPSDEPSGTLVKLPSLRLEDSLVFTLIFNQFVERTVQVRGYSFLDRLTHRWIPCPEGGFLLLGDIYSGYSERQMENLGLLVLSQLRRRGNLYFNRRGILYSTREISCQDIGSVPTSRLSFGAVGAYYVINAAAADTAANREGLIWSDFSVQKALEKAAALVPELFKDDHARCLEMALLEAHCIKDYSTDYWVSATVNYPFFEPYQKLARNIYIPNSTPRTRDALLKTMIMNKSDAIATAQLYLSQRRRPAPPKGTTPLFSFKASNNLIDYFRNHTSLKIITDGPMRAQTKRVTLYEFTKGTWRNLGRVSSSELPVNQRLYILKPRQVETLRSHFENSEPIYAAVCGDNTLYNELLTKHRRNYTVLLRDFATFYLAETGLAGLLGNRWCESPEFLLKNETLEKVIAYQMGLSRNDFDSLVETQGLQSLGFRQGSFDPRRLPREENPHLEEVCKSILASSCSLWYGVHPNDEVYLLWDYEKEADCGLLGFFNLSSKEVLSLMPLHPENRFRLSSAAAFNLYHYWQLNPPTSKSLASSNANPALELLVEHLLQAGIERYVSHAYLERTLTSLPLTELLSHLRALR